MTIEVEPVDGGTWVVRFDDGNQGLAHTADPDEIEFTFGTGGVPALVLNRVDYRGQVAAVRGEDRVWTVPRTRFGSRIRRVHYRYRNYGDDLITYAAADKLASMVCRAAERVACHPDFADQVASRARQLAVGRVGALAEALERTRAKRAKVLVELDEELAGILAELHASVSAARGYDTATAARYVTDPEARQQMDAEAADVFVSGF